MTSQSSVIKKNLENRDRIYNPNKITILRETNFISNFHIKFKHIVRNFIKTNKVQKSCYRKIKVIFNYKKDS